MTKKTKNLAEFVRPLNINGLEGRMLRLPPPKGKKSEVLLIYGHHASLERMFGMVEAINKYAGVTMPDLPGFGGMQSFYKIKQKPTLDNYADYLAAFIKWRYKQSNINIAAISLGFIIVTRMLQRYPELAKRVNIVVSFVGFASREDFSLSKNKLFIGRTMSRTFSLALPAAFLKIFLLRKPIIRGAFNHLGKDHAKLQDAESEEERKKRIEFEVVLWQCNDIRTHMYTLKTMLTLDILDRTVKDVPLHYIGVSNDHYFNAHTVEQHMRVIYPDCTFVTAPLKAHAPTVIADAREATRFLPAKTRALLRSLK